jgi:hypothetical protein
MSDAPRMELSRFARWVLAELVPVFVRFERGEHEPLDRSADRNSILGGRLRHSRRYSRLGC